MSLICATVVWGATLYWWADDCWQARFHRLPRANSVLTIKRRNCWIYISFSYFPISFLFGFKRRRQFKSFLLKTKDLFLIHVEYRDYWSPGNARNQGFVSHVIDLILVVYSSRVSRRWLYRQLPSHPELLFIGKSLLVYSIEHCIKLCIFYGPQWTNFRSTWVFSHLIFRLRDYSRFCLIGYWVEA